MKHLSNKKYIFIASIIGCSSLIYEVCGLKIIFFYFAENTHAVSIALSSFLGGIAFSSLIFSRNYIAGRYEKTLIYLQISSILYTILVLMNTVLIPNILDYIYQSGVSEELQVMFKILIIWIYLFIPAFLLGGAFPILNTLYQKSFKTRCSDVGIVYFFDTLGAILGSLITGFILIPLLGIIYTLYIPVLLSAIVIMYLTQSKKIYILTIFLVCIGGIMGYVYAGDATENSNSLIPYEEKFGSIVFQKSSPYGIVTVGDTPQTENRSLFINYRDECHLNANFSETQLAILTARNLAPEARVMNIGLGCGFTANTLIQAENIEHVTIIEINEVVIEANKKYFSKYNNQLLDSENIHLIHTDGAEYIRTNTTQLFDAIIVDIEEPGVIQSSPLYTLEYAQYIENQLTEDGIFTLWAIHGNEIYSQILYNTLKEVFTYVTFRNDANHVQLYASNRKLDIEETGVEDWNPEIITINTLNNRALESSYDIYDVFDIPEDHIDPRISSIQ